MTFVPNPAGFHALLETVHGPVGRDLERRLINAVSQAKQYATGAPTALANNPEGRGPRVRTGRLRTSITYELEETGSGLVGRFGTNVPYGRFLETGLRGGQVYPFYVPLSPRFSFEHLPHKRFGYAEMIAYRAECHSLRSHCGNTLTVGLLKFRPYASALVLGIRHRLQVIGIHAMAHATKVVELQPVRDRADVALVEIAMRRHKPFLFGAVHEGADIRDAPRTAV